MYVLNSGRHTLLRVLRKPGKDFNDIKETAGQLDESGVRETQLWEPCGVAIDEGNKNVFVADTHNHRVMIFNRTLEYLGQFGRQGSGPAEFMYPVGIAKVGPWIVVADEANKRLQLWEEAREANGSLTARPRMSGLCRGVLKSPFGVVLDFNRQLKVTDRAGGGILAIAFDDMLAALALNATATA